MKIVHKIDKLRPSIPNAAEGVFPPSVDTYKQDKQSNVFISPYHGSDELKENLRIARFMSRKLKSPVYLLPRLDPDNKTENLLRNSLLPKGIPNRKNVDMMSQGKLIEAKSMLSATTAGKKQIKRAIQKRIQEAFNQADDCIIELPDRFIRKDIHAAIKGYLKGAQHTHSIVIKWRGKCLIYSNE